MSSLMHPNLELWNRDEHGSYRAELEGWTLVVKWRDESEGKPRGFWFEATPGGLAGEPSTPPKAKKKIVSDEIHEEIEVAMAYAEAVVIAATAPVAQPHA